MAQIVDSYSESNQNIFLDISFWEYGASMTFGGSLNTQ